MKINECFYYLRKASGIGRREFSEKIGISEGYLCKLEFGTRSPSLGTIRKFCKVLAIPVAYFMVLADPGILPNSAYAGLHKNQVVQKAIDLYLEDREEIKARI